MTELGLPDEFLDHGSRGDILERVGLTPQHIARDVTAMVLGSKLPHARNAGAEVPTDTTRSSGSDRPHDDAHGATETAMDVGERMPRAVVNPMR